MTNLLDLETALCGVYLAVLSALGPERREVANEMLATLATDPRICAYPAQFFRDLVEVAVMVESAPAWRASEELEETVH
jgi:hypothetical protein